MFCKKVVKSCARIIRRQINSTYDGPFPRGHMGLKKTKCHPGVVQDDTTKSDSKANHSWLAAASWL